MALPKNIAQDEARRRTRLGYPHKIATVYCHAEGCLVSDSTILPGYPCTCGRALLAGYTLVLAR
jgi:hypothetical protein